MNILDAMANPKAFAQSFRRRRLRSDTWRAWKAFLVALFALPMDDETRALFERQTGRTDAPRAQCRECFVIAGRRSGKSLIAALVAVFLACFKDYSDVLAPGEVGTVMILSSDRRQARVIFGYILAFLEAPLVKSMVVSQLKESVTLSNRITIEIHTSSFKAVRGYSIVAAICDEVAFWPAEDTANPDTEILAALRPAMATMPDALLLCISSPYAKRGELWRAYRDHYGKPSEVLVWKASSREMNPTLSQAIVATAYMRDRASASAEYGGEFRDDVETFISLEVVESRIAMGIFELPPVADLSYVGFVDPSGGRSDSMTLAVAHERGGIAVLDLLREVEAPFSPENAVAEFADLLKRYRLSEVAGDKYGGEWPREQFVKRGITYRVAEQSRSELYLELLPALMSGQALLLDNPRLVTQLVGLERRTARGGRDSVDHSPGGHDDLANAAAGALVNVLRPVLMQGWTELWKEQSQEADGQLLAPEQVVGRPQLDSQMAVAVETVAPQFGQLGAPKKETIIGTFIQSQTVRQSDVCPNCGNPAISRTCVQGPSGSVSEQCSSCGWSQVIPRAVGLRR